MWAKSLSSCCILVLLLFVIAPASSAQARIWLEDTKSEIATHHIPFVYRLATSSTISTKQLENALQVCVMRHQSLHTSLNFDTEKDQLIQRVTDLHENHNRLFAFIESTYETEEQLDNTIHEEKYNSQLFHLTRGLVFRCHVVYHKERSSNEYLSHNDVLIFNFHHAVFDLQSMNLFLDDLNQAYTTGQLPTNDNNTLRYLDYAIIEQQMSMNGASSFWFDALCDCKLDQPLSLPYDQHRLMDEDRTNHTVSISFDFDQDLSYHFLTYASLYNVTLEQLVLAMYYAFLFKITNSENDLCIGKSIDGRYRNELKSIIGTFDSIIPLRCKLCPYGSCHQLIEYVKEMLTNSMKFSYFPLQRIFNQHSSVSEPATLNTAFQFLSHTLNVVENEPIINNSRLSLMPLTMQMYDNEMMRKFDLVFKIEHARDTNQVSCTINASRDVFKVETVHIIGQQYHSMLKRLFASINDQKLNISVCELSLQLPDEQILTQSINHTQTLFSSMNCVHQEFSYQVVKYPQKLSVELDEQSLTYAELLHYAQILSLYLLKKYSVKSDDIICQCVDRSLSMVIGMMAIEMVGCVYCPLSTKDPQHRLASLLQQTQANIVLVHSLTANKFHNDVTSIDIDATFVDSHMETNIDFEQLSNVTVTLSNRAYVIFTSGSTGIPKAVEIQHRNFIGCIRSLLHIGLYTFQDTVIQMASCSYDVHVQEVLGTLILGANLVFLHPEGNMDVEYVVKILKEKQITYMQSVPAYLNNMCDFLLKNDHPKLETLRTLDIGGDKSTVQLFEKLYKHILENTRIVHLYGPAETTIDCTYHCVDMQLDKSSAPIGRLLPNYTCMVLDELLQHVPINRDGELYVGGIGVFAGYLRHRELTGKAQLSINGQIFYRTGDLATVDNNGLLHYRGRKDYQVKLYGQRIELEEIEKCLLNTSISACIVTKWNDSQLIAYVQSSTIDDNQIRKHCQTYLPSHMIPSKFIILEQLPLNANGKVDRKRLPAPHDFIQSDNCTSGTVPVTPLEEHLCRIFSEAFHNNSPDVNMSFGQMGGTSLDAIKALWLIRKEISGKIDAVTLFSNPTVRQLAQAIELSVIKSDETSIKSEIVESINEKERPKPSLCIEIIGILLIVTHGLCPLWSLYYFNLPTALIFIPVFHLLSYVVCQRLMFLPQGIINQKDKLYSWRYYRWWFLNSLWLTNNSYWLHHIIGTPFYNFYLRLCGAKIGRHTHIYTTLIDAPWLIEIGESTFIDEEVIFSNLSYQDHTYELYPIYIGSCCSVNTRSVLYDKVIIEDHVYVEPMSAVTGRLVASSDRIVIKDRSISMNQTIYQFIHLAGLFLVHNILLFSAYGVYHCFVIMSLPLPIRLTLTWFIWILMCISTALLLLKFLVGPIDTGHYQLNSYYYLHKSWLRQLIITSFSHSLDRVPAYEAFAPVIFRWLGARIENDVKFSDFRKILYFPSNLFTVGSGVTTFLEAKLHPYEMTREGLCCFDRIHLDTNTTLGNWCTIMPGAQVPSEIIISSLSLVTRETVSRDTKKVLLGIPALDYWIFFMPYLSGTQLLVFVFRIMGAKIGCDVILNGILCITDPFLTTIGNHVRLHMGTHILCHSFEQRLMKFARVTVNDSAVLMSRTAIFSGATLGGKNRILPLTLVMKNDQLEHNTNWSGVPAQKVK
ncbi:unnamed protein product [Adineta ricciae]|uniref:Carrier domain-containing protein n=1 Tax=Adineta ricciae TaxID=249248 RepID=A0A815PV30_ADIRI|nr:unnamed protein product [Adineta ricciae]